MPTVPCSRCGHENELGRVFCESCGLKLDLSRIRARKFRPRSGFGTFLVGTVRLVFGLGLLAVLGLLFWPVSPSGDEGNAASAIQARGQMQTLARGIESGQPVIEIISEAGINAYVAELLKKDPSATESSMVRLGVSRIDVDVSKKRLAVLVLANWGGIPLSYEISGTPVVDGKSFRMKLWGARWGHLPLPGAAGGWLAGRVAGIFSRMADERKVLDHLSRFDLGEGKVRLVAGRL